MSDIGSYDALVLDIEGTTTPISFVYETLFPFAREHLARFLETHWDDPAVQSDIALVETQALADATEGVEGVVPVPVGGDEETRRRAVVENLRWQMDNDRKTTALKSLQGKIWKNGYAEGTLKGELFEDVPEAFDRWSEAGVPVFIYSSGSIQAQKLLFGHSEYGDLTTVISGYFDTTTGPKKDPMSYTKIAESLRDDAEDLLFATDDLDEANAAHTAGWNVVVMARPGNAETPEHGFPVAEDFGPLLAALD